MSGGSPAVEGGESARPIGFVERLYNNGDPSPRASWRRPRKGSLCTVCSRDIGVHQFLGRNVWLMKRPSLVVEGL